MKIERFGLLLTYYWSIKYENREIWIFIITYYWSMKYENREIWIIITYLLLITYYLPMSSSYLAPCCDVASAKFKFALILFALNGPVELPGNVGTDIWSPSTGPSPP